VEDAECGRGSCRSGERISSPERLQPRQRGKGGQLGSEGTVPRLRGESSAWPAMRDAASCGGLPRSRSRHPIWVSMRFGVGRGSANGSRSRLSCPAREPGEQDADFTWAEGEPGAVYSMGSSRVQVPVTTIGHAARPSRVSTRDAHVAQRGDHPVHGRLTQGVIAGSIDRGEAVPGQQGRKRQPGPRFPNLPRSSTSSGACRPATPNPATCQIPVRPGPRSRPWRTGAAAGAWTSSPSSRPFDSGWLPTASAPEHQGARWEHGFVAGATSHMAEVSGPAAAGGSPGRLWGAECMEWFWSCRCGEGLAQVVMRGYAE